MHAQSNPAVREVRRQLFHCALGLVIALGVFYGVLGAFHLLALLAAGALISFASTRMRVPVIAWFLDRFERPENEKMPGKSVLFYVGGVALVLLLHFPSDIAVASIMVLAVGDSVSHLVGRFWGRTPSPLSSSKLLEGFLCGAAASFIAAVAFVPPLEALLASVAAMAAESLEIRLRESTMDDNLTVPLVAASVMMLVRVLG